MAKAITGRITLNLVAGILVTVVTVSGAILWMAQKQNDQADEATTTMVVGGLQAILRQYVATMDAVLKKRASEGA